MKNIFADETADLLRAALAQAEAIKKTADDFMSEDSMPNAAEAEALLKQARDLCAGIDSAQDAANTTLAEVQSL